MKLKKLIISGFKSFADKVSLNFDDGITGIVGPNGSGKSNVVDAVRWVMGEQSAKHLRGQVATDIIFAGSDKRKALGMAEVTLVFDNADFSDLCPPEYRNEPEISLGRRLYIDGQREYFINKKPCRLKDIIDFFTLTGLGGRSYSMIQQGQVDRILNAKPEDVRQILEEAAGTLAYKSRRDACFKKLEKTNENLSRIEDILAEIGRQLESLEGQVEKARKWQSINDELRHRELTLLKHNFHHFRSGLDKLEAEAARSEEEESELIAQQSKQETRLTALQKQLADADPELEQLRERLAQIRESIVRAEGQMTRAFEAIEAGEERLEEIEHEVRTDEDNLAALKEIVSSSVRELELAQEDYLSLSDSLETLKDELERADEAAQVFRNREDQLKDDLKNLEMLLESNALRSEAIERDRQKSLDEVEAYKGKIKSLETDLKEQAATVARWEQAVQDGQIGVDKDLEARNAKESQLTRLDHEFEEIQKASRLVEKEYISTSTRLESLKEILASSGNAHEVLELLSTLNNEFSQESLGVLSDYIELSPENSMPSLAQKAFDSWADRIILKSAKYLKQLIANKAFPQDLPRIALSINQEMSHKEVSDLSRWTEKNGVVPILKFIKSTQDSDRLDLLLNRLFVLPEELETEIDLTSMPSGVTVFTCGGSVLNSSLDVVIESGQKKGVLERKAEIKGLERIRTDLEKQISELEENIEMIAADRSSVKRELQEADEHLKSQNATILENVRAFQTEKQNLEFKENQLEECQKQLAHHQKSYEIFAQELENLGEARLSLGQQREDLSEDAEGFRDESTDVMEASEELRRQYDAKRLEHNQLDAKVQAKKEVIETQQKQVHLMESSFVRRAEEKEKIKRDLEKARLNEVECTEQMKEALTERASLEESLNQKRDANSELYNQVKAIEESLKVTRAKLNSLQKKGSGSALERERLKIALQGVEEQAVERFQLQLSETEFQLDPQFEASKEGQKIQKLKLEMEGLGAINMMAIEEFEKHKERNEFIQAQRDDVISSIGLLNDAIEEIELSAKERFLGVFEQINLNFSELFPVLFPGGDARLHLTSEDDPLNGGVDILVRLPGKKQRSMTLFSGGEKALTAISLIFALLKTKPTPFCFLDEVDAPLDEANVGRYNNVLEFLAERFQFVVITHNRRTMEVLDQLYGVTMMEGGVSRVVGVDLKKALPDHLKKSFKQEKKASP